MITDTATAADESASSAETLGRNFANMDAIRTAMLRMVSANTCVYAEHFFGTKG